MKAMIFAAGLGTRLKPLTDSIPKALVPIAGKPLLYHLVMKMKRAGIEEIVINVHHFAQSVIDYVHSQNDFGIKICFSDESGELLETGGGILNARNYLEGEPFLVHNVDILSNLDLSEFMAMAGKNPPETLANILVSERVTKRYFLFDGDNRLRGWTNVETGEVRSPYSEPEAAKMRKLAFAGVHLVSGDIFKVMENDGWKGKFSVTDFYIRECGNWPIRGIQVPGLRILDVGKTESLKEAEIFINQFYNF